MADEPGQFEVPDGGLSAIRSNREPTDYRVLKAPYGRAYVADGVYSIPSHTWVRIDEVQIRHELGHNALVSVGGVAITFLTAGEWQIKQTIPAGTVVQRGPWR